MIVEKIKNYLICTENMYDAISNDNMIVFEGQLKKRDDILLSLDVSDIRDVDNSIQEMLNRIILLETQIEEKVQVRMKEIDGKRKKATTEIKSLKHSSGISQKYKYGDNHLNQSSYIDEKK